MNDRKKHKLQEKIRSYLGKMKITGIRNKFFHTMIFIGIIPLLCLGVFSNFSMNGVLKAQTIDFHTQNLRHKEVYLELFMSNIESLVANISGNDEVNNALQEKTTDSSYDRLNTQAKIGYILSGYTNLNGLVSIDIFTNNGIQYHVGETLNVTNVDVALRDRLFEETKVSDDFVYWSGIETNVNKDSRYANVIIAAKILKPNGGGAVEGENAKGLLIVSYNPAVLGDAIGQESGDGDYGIILDSKNRILYHPDSNYIGKTLADSLTADIGPDEGNFEHSIDGKKMLVIYDKTQKGGWTVADFIPTKNIYANNYMVTFFVVLVVCIAILLLIVFQTMLTKQVLKPIGKITHTFRLLKNGQLENAGRLDIKSKDELGELRNLFNDFIDAREDITTQKKLERQLHEQNLELQQTLGRLKETQTQMLGQEKLAGIGQLAAGVAHEINNPLGFVTANFDILKQYITWYEGVLRLVENAVINDGVADQQDCKQLVAEKWKENKLNMVLSDMQELLSDTDDGLKRIAGIVDGLKSFSRIRKGDEIVSYNLNEGVKTTLLVATNELKYHCKVNFEKGEIPEIHANGGELNQVVLNILMNAAYAIQEKFGDKKGEIRIKTFAEGDSVFLSICDNGCGMTEDVKNKIFEPFFTTKPVGRGTGLGLGIAYDIIYNKHGGSIEVDSRPGEGTCFLLRLPIKRERN